MNETPELDAALRGVFHGHRATRGAWPTHRRKAAAQRRNKRRPKPTAKRPKK